MRPLVNASAGSKPLTQMTIWKGRIVGLVHQFAKLERASALREFESLPFRHITKECV